MKRATAKLSSAPSGRRGETLYVRAPVSAVEMAFGKETVAILLEGEKALVDHGAKCHLARADQGAPWWGFSGYAVDNCDAIRSALKLHRVYRMLVSGGRGFVDGIGPAFRGLAPHR